MAAEDQPLQSARGEGNVDREPALPVPQDQSEIDWAKKASRALEARELGQKLRQGKRVLFPSMHSQRS
jgi:hypothetical protein